MGLLLAHPDFHVLTQQPFLKDSAVVMSNDALDLVEPFRFDYELKGFSRRQYPET